VTEFIRSHRYLEVDESGVTRLEAFFEKATESTRTDHSEREVELPLQGQRYLIDLTTDPVGVVREDGVEPGETELKVIRSEYVKDDGWVGPVQEAITAGPLELGRTIVLSPEACARSPFNSEDDRVTDLRITPREVLDGVACFDLVISLEGPVGPDAIGPKVLTSELCLLVDGNATVRRSLEEPFWLTDTYEVNGVQVTREGAGVFRFEERISYGQ
jgi:hypothetical protein